MIAYAFVHKVNVATCTLCPWFTRSPFAHEAVHNGNVHLAVAHSTGRYA